MHFNTICCPVYSTNTLFYIYIFFKTKSVDRGFSFKFLVIFPTWNNITIIPGEFLRAGLCSWRAVWKATVQTHAPAVPARTAVYLYSSRWLLALHMPTDCQWQEGMDRFQPPNLSAVCPNHTLPSSPQTVVAPPNPTHSPSRFGHKQRTQAPPHPGWQRPQRGFEKPPARRKHAKPAGLHSHTEQTHKFNNDRDVRQPLRWWRAVAASPTANVRHHNRHQWRAALLVNNMCDAKFKWQMPNVYKY